MEPPSPGVRERARLLARHLPPSLRVALKGVAARVPRPRRPPAAGPVAGLGALRGDVLVTPGAPAPAEALVLGVDVVADLAEPGSLPPARFDAIVLADGVDATALANAWQALRPGGVLLAAGTSREALARACPGAAELEPGRAVK